MIDALAAKSIERNQIMARVKVKAKELKEMCEKVIGICESHMDKTIEKRNRFRKKWNGYVKKRYNSLPAWRRFFSSLNEKRPYKYAGVVKDPIRMIDECFGFYFFDEKRKNGKCKNRELEQINYASFGFSKIYFYAKSLKSLCHKGLTMNNDFIEIDNNDSDMISKMIELLQAQKEYENSNKK